MLMLEWECDVKSS